MASINFSIEGLESIQEEYDRSITNKIRKPIKAGLKALDSDMRSMLRGYIEADVYDVYHPDSYLRRVDNPEFGTSISDIDKTVFSNFMGYNALQFSYEPTGFHTLYENEPYVDGDDLITVIETGKHHPWHMKPRPIDGRQNRFGEILNPRPFWTNFCTELFNHDQAEYSFINGFNANSGDIGKLTPENNIELSSSDDYTFKY